MSTKSSYKVAPLRGGQIDNDTSFTGGIPVLDNTKVFTSTTTTSSGPPSFMAIRTSNVSNMMKVEIGAKAAPSIIFTSATDPAYGLMTYTGMVHRHFVEYGLDAIFYFPTHDGTLVSILEGHSQFTREEISKQSLKLFNNRDDATKILPLERYDMYDLQNLRFSAAFILASISPTLRAQVLTKAGKDYDNGPIIWMYVMGLVQSSSYRGTKMLQRTFEERKLKSEQGENVIKHTIKLRDDYMRLSNANMIPYDSLMTVIDSLIDSSTPTFSVWAATKRITVSRFLKENAGKTPSALSSILNAPTVEAICDEADDEYQSLLESGLWIAMDSKKDKEAAPTTFLLEKLSAKVDKLTANISKREGTCWTCGEEGHKSPDCPKKNGNSPASSKDKKDKNQKNKEKSTNLRPEWKTTAPKSGKSEQMIRNKKTWLWCATCKYWSTTHGTSTHKSRQSTDEKEKDSKPKEKKEEKQSNLAEIVVQNNNSPELVMGAWCGFITETNGTNAIPACASTQHTCNLCHSPFLCISPTASNFTCFLCLPENTGKFAPEQDIEKLLIPADTTEKIQPIDQDDYTLETVSMDSSPTKPADTLLNLAQDNFFHVDTPPQIDTIAHVTPLSDPAWKTSCQYLQSDPGIYLSNHNDENDHFKVIWDTGASEVITSDPSDFIGGVYQTKLSASPPWCFLWHTC